MSDLRDRLLDAVAHAWDATDLSRDQSRGPMRRLSIHLKITFGRDEPDEDGPPLIDQTVPANIERAQPDEPAEVTCRPIGFGPGHVTISQPLKPSQRPIPTPPKSTPLHATKEHM